MHRHWTAQEEESSRLIDLVLYGQDEDLVRHLAQLPHESRRTSITHLGKDGNSALHFAAMRERLGGLSAMMDANVDVGIRNGSGESPLYVSLCHNALKSARILIHNGADVNEITGRKDNEYLMHKMVKGDRGAAVDILLDAGACVDSKAQKGDTPLHYAARYNRPMIARQLVQGGANVNAANDMKETPLHTAVAHRTLDVAKILIKANAKVDVPDRQGMTALHQAVASGIIDIVRLMLHNNSTHVNSKEKLMGRTPLLLACSGTHQKLAPLLLSHGADANLTTNYRKTVLHLAATAGNTHALNAVIKHASNLNALTTNNNTPLHCAVNAGHPEAVRTLLRAGVNPNLKDIEGDTALHMAAACGHSHIAEQLLLHPGLHVNATNMRQRTALHAALMAGHEHTGELLIAAGCDSHMLDVFEKNAYDYLEEYQRRLRELEEKDHPPEHEASKVHFSHEEHGGPSNNEDNDALLETGGANHSTVYLHTCEDEEMQVDIMPMLSLDTKENIGNEQIQLKLENGDVRLYEDDASALANHLGPLSCEYSEITEEEVEENEDEEQHGFEEDNNVVSLLSVESSHKKAGKSRSRHRKTSKSRSKGTGQASPRHSRSSTGKGGRHSHSSATSDAGGGVLGMVMAGHGHEHHDHSAAPSAEAKADQPHQHQHPHGEAGRGRRRKLGIAYMK
ncbi:hypothetical protein EGW08_003654 [Elysia chlorotica]|uniref:Uncharacterized protein n=1 Tax=Elysia chlorotica TaxID=188477 RepID=A0A3S1BTW2_ELYCH|nr:hypothetical protein EGW08_003654 [Elysia chlorotica]